MYGGVPDQCSKVSMAIQSYQFSGFPVHIEVILVCVCAGSVAKSCPTLCNAMDYIPSGYIPLPMGFSRQEYWSHTQFSSVAKSCPTLCDPMDARLSCPSLSPGVCSNSHPSVMPSNHLIFCHPLLLLPPIFPSMRVFSGESVLRIR